MAGWWVRASRYTRAPLCVEGRDAGHARAIGTLGRQECGGMVGACIMYGRGVSRLLMYACLQDLGRTGGARTGKQDLGTVGLWFMA